MVRVSDGTNQTDAVDLDAGQGLHACGESVDKGLEQLRQQRVHKRPRGGVGGGVGGDQRG
jgi:hypothetical protein